MFRSIIIGNLGSDARVETSNGRQFVSFSVGHNDRYTDKDGVEHDSTQWISCAMNGDGGKLLQYLKKGRQVYVEGRTTTRVFSSEKERRMVAGVNLSVDHLELVGGQVEEVPRRLADSTGYLHDVKKAYFIGQTEARTLCGEKPEVLLMSTDNRRFSVNRNGWIKPIVEETTNMENNGQQSANNEPEVF